MKRLASKGLFVQFSTLVSAMRYCQAAKWDEKKGFPFSAASKWRTAAGLSVSVMFLTNYCWQEWERLMHLPRRLAGPIGVAHVVTL